MRITRLSTICILVAALGVNTQVNKFEQVSRCQQKSRGEGYPGPMYGGGGGLGSYPGPMSGYG